MSNWILSRNHKARALTIAAIVLMFPDLNSQPFQLCNVQSIHFHQAVDKKYGKKCLKVKNKNGGLALLSTNTVSKTLKARRSHEVLTSKIGSRCTDIEQGNKNGCNAVMPARRTEKKLVSSLFHNNPSIPLIKRYLCTCIYMCIYICMYIFMSYTSLIYIYVCVCIYIYIYIKH